VDVTTWTDFARSRTDVARLRRGPEPRRAGTRA